MCELIKDCTMCGKAFRGRKDKRFCCDACRNLFNNQLREKEKKDADVFSVNAILFKNRMILKSLLGSNRLIHELNAAELVYEGFVFGFHTHQVEDCEGSVYLFCYDYGYCFRTERVVWVSSKRARIFRPQIKSV